MVYGLVAGQVTRVLKKEHSREASKEDKFCADSLYKTSQKMVFTKNVKCRLGSQVNITC